MVVVLGEDRIILFINLMRLYMWIWGGDDKYFRLN